MDASEIAYALESLDMLSTTQRVKMYFDSMQLEKDKAYTDPEDRAVPRFRKGEQVVTCSNGLYYFGEITVVSEEVCLVLKKNVPCYRVLNRGWKSAVPGMDWVMEYDMASLTGQPQPQELLAAHWWNVMKIKELGGLTTRQKTGLFTLDETEIDRLETDIRDGRTSLNTIPGTETWTTKKWLGLC
ncbi:hypothetical protein BV898_03978 [Hypsibius exemplaris]|uniref:Uncharacterized protein n=1 Tax=Hypsibius exemplaris TaxID=2072580 RepID=A0A1W0X4A8_HYPEX|nr:hypothetical protein BV898_03978 [Hypsibius exemplaris]